MGTSVVIRAALGAPVWSTAGKVEFLLGMLGALLVLVALIGGLIYQIFFVGFTRSTGGKVLDDTSRPVEDLGPLRRSFTNYSPWELRLGVSLTVVGAACGVIGYFGEYGWLLAIAALALAVGIPTLLQAILKRIDHLDLHARGLLLRQGKSRATVVSYSDIKSSHYNILVYSNGSKVLIDLVLELHDGGALQIGKDFNGLGSIAGAITEAANACSDEQ